MRELLPGVYRLETEMGDARLCLHVIRGERTLLIDTGPRTAPDTSIFPALRAAGLPELIDFLLVSHADADHHGGNAAVRTRSPGVTILAHELDRPRIEAKACHLAGRYTEIVANDDVRYAPEIMSWLSDMIGPDTVVDVRLRGGETLTLGDGLRYEVLHTPGHTAGHLSVWNPERHLLIMQDAALGSGMPDRRGGITSPPPYYDVTAYVDTVQRLQALNPEWLLTAHFPVMRGPEVPAFFAASLEFVDRVDSAVLAAVTESQRPLRLSAIIDAVDAWIGPFAIPIQWFGPTLAHLDRHVRDGRLWVQHDVHGRTWGHG